MCSAICALHKLGAYIRRAKLVHRYQEAIYESEVAIRDEREANMDKERGLVLSRDFDLLIF